MINKLLRARYVEWQRAGTGRHQHHLAFLPTVMLCLNLEDPIGFRDTRHAVAQHRSSAGSDPPGQQLHGLGPKECLFTDLIVQLLLCAGLSAKLLRDQEHGPLLALGIGCGGESGCPTAKNNYVVHTSS